MTAQIAATLARDGRCVVDPYLASRALGDGMRRFADDAVRDLASRIGARTIVRVYAGHDGKFTLNAQLRAETRPSTDVAFALSAAATLEPVKFSDEAPPFVAWKPRLDTIATLLGVGATTTTAKPDDAAFALPDSPAGLVGTDVGPRRAANVYAVLAAMGPPTDDRATERLHEKSWLAADTLPADPESRRLRARALLHLGFRPAAHAALGKDADAEAGVLRALADGNLPDAERALAEVRAPLDRFAASLETLDLRWQYRSDASVDAPPPTLAETIARSRTWSLVVNLRGHDGDRRFVTDNASLGRLLAQIHPVAAGGDAAPTLLAPARHVAAALEEKAAALCCRSFALQPAMLDLLDVLDARGRFAIEKSVLHDGWVQGLGDRATATLDVADAVFEGHPRLLRLRAALALDALQREPTGGDSPTMQELRSSARRAAFLEQGLSGASAEAMVALGVPSPASQPFIDGYATDFPPRAYWTYPDSPMAIARSLAYATTLPDTLELHLRVSIASGQPVAPAIGEALQRFRGAPQIASLRLAAGGGTKPDVAAMRTAVADAPADWQLRSTLATALVESGDYDGARDTVASWPGLADPNASTVAAANRIHEIARLLYWHGASGQARALYGIAADYDNGAEATLIARIRVRVLDGDLSGARAISQQRVARYDNPYGHAEYLALSFALGPSKDTWRAFDDVAGRFDEPAAWQAAFVGHRVDGHTDREVLDWASSEPVRGIVAKSGQPALRFALTASVVDRAPPENLADALARIEGTPQGRSDGSSGVRLPYDGGSAQRSRYKAAAPPAARDGDPVASGYVMVADAIVRQRRGDHAGAVAAFERLASFYAIEDGPMRFALPLFAYSAAKAGDDAKLRAFVDGLSPARASSFDAQLAQALFAGLDGGHDVALERLRRAFGVMQPWNGTDALPQAYHYAQTCIVLFEETGDVRYRDLALDWARRYRRVDPPAAWAYALEARFGDAREETHPRAVALATYLDRRSAWLGGVAQAERDRAGAWLKRNAPFAEPKKKPVAQQD
ncbi:MAG TPA: hypothetical protein VJ724_07295 [Tahibacter sp.]|nr:hypothetical protein [Tahibacter sp.]